MPTRGDIQVNVFSKGLITESSPLSFPTDAALDVINMHLKRNGTMERRLGMDFEDSYVLTSTGLSSDVLAGARVTAYRWSIPNGQSTVDIGVIQIGNSLYFINLFASAPSASLLNGGSPVTAVGTSNDQIMSFATINNYLIVVSNVLGDPYLFSYDEDTDTISWETAPIQIRDIWGVDDSLSENERPTTLSDEHRYNLYNQGWDDNIVTTCGAGITALDCTFNTFGVYPSNSDQWSIGRVEDVTSADVDKYDPNIAARNLVNTGQVAKGHFIISLFNRGADRTSHTGLALPTDRENGAITYVASYAGRVFYAGILSRVLDGDNRSPNLSGAVLFSQVFNNKINLVNCYQEADPTSPDFNEVVDTDGGIIVIPGCDYIFGLVPTKESLFVFGANGVWEISGDDGGFRATAFQVNKISNVGVYAPKSIVEVNNTFFFWGDSGIYTLTRNQFGLWDTTNITLPSIQRFYNALPDASKKNARGYHDLHTNTARWLYYSADAHVVGDPIDQDTSPNPLVTIIGDPIQITDAAINASRLSLVRITDTKYVIVFNHTSSSKIQYITCNVNESTFTVTNTTPADLVTGIGSTSYIKATPIDDTKFLLTTTTSVGNDQARIISISGNTCTAGSPTTLIVFDANVTIADVIELNSGRALVSFRRSPAAGVPRSRVINYSSGSIILGTLYDHAVTSTAKQALQVVTAGTTSTVLFYVQEYVNMLTINSSDIITEGSRLNTSTRTFTDTATRISDIGGNKTICGVSAQFVVVTNTDPPTETAYFDSVTPSLGTTFNSDVKHDMIKIPSVTQVARYIIPSSGALQNTACYQYLGITGSAVTETKAITSLLTSLSNPTVSYLTPIELSSSIETSAWACISSNKIITQMLRLV